MGFRIDRYQYIPIGASIHIDKTRIAEGGIDNTLLAQAGIDQYHYWLKPVSIIQYVRYIDTIESSEVSIGCLVTVTVAVHITVSVTVTVTVTAWVMLTVIVSITTTVRVTVTVTVTVTM